MAKKNQIKKIPAVKSNASDLDLLLDKYFWLVIPLFAVIYYLSSKYSPGFYQDDEIGHFTNMKEFWTDPYAIFGNWPKPGYKFIMVLPSLLGYQAVLFMNALIASTTIYLTYRLIKLYNIKYAFFGALMLAFQPLFFDLSFRSYAEIFSAMLFIIMIMCYKKEKYFLCGLVFGYIFTVRQEAALIGLFLAFIFFQKKDYKAIAAMLIFPLIINFFGYLKSGDIFYTITEMSSLGAMDFGGAERGFFHYFKVYIFIIGPVCLTLFMLGYFGFLSDTKRMKEYYRKYDMVYVVFTLTFLVQILLMLKGTNPGTWRYVLQVSPFAAFFAVVGLNNLSSAQFKKTNYIVSGVLLFFTLVFSSRASSGLDLLPTAEYGKFAFVLIAFLLTLILFSNDTRAYLNKLSVILIILSVVYFLVSFQPRLLTAENLTVKQVGEYLASKDAAEKKVFMTTQITSPIILFGDLSPQRKKDFVHLTSQNLASAQKGDLVIWDSHYSYRPEYKNDVKLQSLEDNVNYKKIKEFHSSDDLFKTVIFEKLN